MTKKGYELIQLVLKYGDLNFKVGNKSREWNEFAKQDDELYKEIFKAVKELDEGGKNDE